MNFVENDIDKWEKNNFSTQSEHFIGIYDN